MKPGNQQSTDDENPPISGLPKVTESYAGYAPPFDAKRLVEKMIATVPPKYLTGLREVVLTNFSELSRKTRRTTTKSRGRKVKIAEAAGRYHPAWKNQPAWVEIFVDNSLRNWEKGWWLKLPLLRESLIGDVLFHEIGHHIHFAIRPEYREREDVADVWKARLSRNWSRRSYPFLRVIAGGFKFWSGPVFDSLIRRSLEKELEKGLISRAEFEERKSKSREL